MRGSLKANDKYCSKESEMVHIGKRPTNANSNCVMAAKRMIDEGHTITDLAAVQSPW